MILMISIPDLLHFLCFVFEDIFKSILEECVVDEV